MCLLARRDDGRCSSWYLLHSIVRPRCVPKSEQRDVCDEHVVQGMSLRRYSVAYFWLGLVYADAEPLLSELHVLRTPALQMTGSPPRARSSGNHVRFWWNFHLSLSAWTAGVCVWQAFTKLVGTTQSLRDFEHEDDWSRTGTGKRSMNHISKVSWYHILAVGRLARAKLSIRTRVGGVPTYCIVSDGAMTGETPLGDVMSTPAPVSHRNSIFFRMHSTWPC